MKEIMIKLCDKHYNRILDKHDFNGTYTDAEVQSMVRAIDNGREIKNAYVVTTNGMFSEEGMEIYLIGVFTDKSSATIAARDNRGTITKIPLNKAFPLTMTGKVTELIDDDGAEYLHYEMANKYWLGGYATEIT